MPILCPSLQEHSNPVFFEARVVRTDQEVPMFFDVAVFAGLATVGLMFAFFAGIGWFIRSDIRKHKAQ